MGTFLPNSREIDVASHSPYESSAPSYSWPSPPPIGIDRSSKTGNCVSTATEDAGPCLFF
jgi:hypothetical protein